MPERIPDHELKAIVNSEIRSAMGELTGELSTDRAQAMDYYYGEPVGKLYQPNDDRSRVVITTLRDTVELIMPELMRMFAQPDKIVEFEAVGSEDEDAADPVQITEELDVANSLRVSIERLPEREGRILALRYGFYDGVPRTLEEIGEEFNLTRERIRQLEKLALCRLRHPSFGIREQDLI